jgi:hypothetical protein
MNDSYIGKLFAMDWHPPSVGVDLEQNIYLYMVVSAAAHGNDYICESLTSGRQYVYNEYEIIRGLVSYKHWKEQNNV